MWTPMRLVSPDTGSGSVQDGSGDEVGEGSALLGGQDGDEDGLGRTGRGDHGHPDGISAFGAAGFIVSIILGLGVLGIPWAFARVGWVVGLLLLLLSAAGSVYSGRLINDVAACVADASPLSPPRKYADLGRAAFGPHGESAVRGIQLAFLAGCIVAVQLTASNSLHTVVGALHGKSCLVTCNTAVALAMLPLMQAQRLKEITAVAVGGVVMILVPLALYLSQLPREPSETSVGVPRASTVHDVASAVTTLCFAYQGQTIFPEIRYEMSSRKEFPRAVVGATALMTCAYVVVCVAGYRALGHTAEYLNVWDNENNPRDARTVAANIMLIIHVMTGYTINGNVLNQAVAEAVYGRAPSRLAWLSVTVVTLAASWALSNAVPSLGVLIAFVGATCGVSLTFLVPIACAFKLLSKRWEPWRRRAHAAVGVVAVAILAVGSVTTGERLVRGMASHGGAFGC